MRQALGPGALGRPRGSGWRGRWEGGSGWGTHVNPWLFHFNVWQNPLQIKKKRKRIRLPMQRTQVWFLVQEDSTCDGATKPMLHDPWARAQGPVSHCSWAWVLQLLKPSPRVCALQQEEPPKWEACTAQQRMDLTRCNCRKLVQSNDDPAQPKINKIKIYVNMYVKRNHKIGIGRSE